MILRVSKHVDGEFVSTNSTSSDVPTDLFTLQAPQMQLRAASAPPDSSDSLLVIGALALEKPAVTTPVLSRLITEVRGKHIFQGAATVTSDGVPFFLVPTPDLATFKAFKQKEPVLRVWNWDTPYGNILNLSVMTRSGAPAAHVFMPVEDPHCVAALKTGKIAFAACHGAMVSDSFVADFSTDLMRCNALLVLRNLPPAPDFLFTDADLAYWWLMGQHNAEWSRQLAARPQDALQIGWAMSVTERARAFSACFAEEHATYLSQGMPKSYSDPGIRDKHPYLFRLLSAVAEAVPLGDLIANAGQTLLVAEAADDILNGIEKVAQLGLGDETTFNLALNALRLSWRAHSAVRSGRRRPWFDDRGTMITPKFIDLDPKAIGLDGKDYWRDIDLRAPFNHGLFISGTDLPADPLAFKRSLSAVSHHGAALSDASSLIQSLLVEAKEHRQWTVPWDARVRIAVGDIRFVDVYEIKSVFYCMMRDARERYLGAVVDLENAIVDVPELHRGDDNGSEDTKKALSTIGIILASVIRDFLVVENRESVFSQRTRKPTLPWRRGNPPQRSIIYLPRARHTHLEGIRGTKSVFSSFKPRATHEVSGHLRRSDSVSPAQAILAHQHGFHIPEGFTYVRPHRRGLRASHEVQREFRSRSATRSLFATMDNEAETPVARFEFDRKIVRLLESLGLTVQPFTANESGGMDAHTYNSDTNEIWVIRCLFLDSWQTVDVDTVRDFADALRGYRAGTKGMIVTTSGFTQGAKDEAAACGFTLLDGAQFAAIVNKR